MSTSKVHSLPVSAKAVTRQNSKRNPRSERKARTPNRPSKQEALKATEQEGQGKAVCLVADVKDEGAVNVAKLNNDT